ncbi:hypothetical protein [Limimaricola pyoseonensis]|uniref:Lipid A 3-O-deacylase (PagL) n=1 Tax=Limimaricola pyoseonensis TaxID=521013 RepID=A0A1G7K3F7_9RHOB|nr:hypothetical protein [Limimaricola pyoseonensis]SDF31574.1 hypothetical protein SAMN04488567_0105 [Limimaricola pyoseonensis]
MTRRPPLALLLICVLLPGSAAAQAVDYGAVYLRSWHLGTDTLNDATPGLAFGRRWAAGESGRELHLEGGVFLNSYDEISPLLLGGVSWPFAEAGPGTLRIGASLGAARYESRARQLRADYAIPDLGGFLPLAALSASYRIGRTDLRLTTVPPGEGVTAVFNFSLSRAF